MANTVKLLPHQDHSIRHPLTGECYECGAPVGEHYTTCSRCISPTRSQPQLARVPSDAAGVRTPEGKKEEVKADAEPIGSPK